MTNSREEFETQNENNETIKKLDKTIANINKEAEKLTDFFNYIEKNNLGIDIIQPQIAQIDEYITENLKRIKQLRDELSND